eukprot:359595-Chlamydomonas_euryale.AAC.1
MPVEQLCLGALGREHKVNSGVYQVSPGVYRVTPGVHQPPSVQQPTCDWPLDGTFSQPPSAQQPTCDWPLDGTFSQPPSVQQPTPVTRGLLCAWRLREGAIKLLQTSRLISVSRPDGRVSHTGGREFALTSCKAYGYTQMRFVQLDKKSGGGPTHEVGLSLSETLPHSLLAGPRRRARAC